MGSALERYEGYMGTVDIDADSITIRHRGVARLGKSKETRIPLTLLSGVEHRETSRLTNGSLRLLSSAIAEPTDPRLRGKVSDPGAVLFTWKQRDVLARLHGRLVEIASANGPVEPVEGRAELVDEAAVLAPSPGTEPRPSARPATTENADPEVKTKAKVPAAALGMGKPKLSRVGDTSSGTLACPKCRGTQFKAKRSGLGKLATAPLPVAMPLVPKHHVKCVTCGTTYRRG